MGRLFSLFVTVLQNSTLLFTRVMIASFTGMWFPLVKIAMSEKRLGQPIFYKALTLLTQMAHLYFCWRNIWMMILLKLC